MITSGKFAGNYIVVNTDKIAFVSKDPVSVSGSKLVSSMYQDEIRTVIKVNLSATGDETKVLEWLQKLKAASNEYSKVYTVKIIWQDGEESIANVTDTQYSKLLETQKLRNPRYAQQKPTTRDIQSSKVTATQMPANSRNAYQQSATYNMGEQADRRTETGPLKKLLSVPGAGCICFGICFAMLGLILSLILSGIPTLLSCIAGVLCIVVGLMVFVSNTGKERAMKILFVVVLAGLLLALVFGVSWIVKNSGGNTGSEWATCHKCGGDGRVENSLGIEVECPQCDGVGFIP